MFSDCRASINMTSRLIEPQLDKVGPTRAASSEQAWRPSLPSTKQTRCLFGIHGSYKRRSVTTVLLALKWQLMLWIRISGRVVQHYVIKFVSHLRQVGGRRFSPGPPISYINKTDRHDINWNIVESAVKHHQPNKLKWHRATARK